MDLWQCLFNREFLEVLLAQFRKEVDEIVASGHAQPIIYESSCDANVDLLAATESLKPQTINEFRKARVQMTEAPIQVGRFFLTELSADAMWLLQYKFFTVLYVSDALFELVQQGSPKAVSDGFLRYFRSYFERHLCGVGSASKKKGVLKTMLVNTEPIDFVITESLRISRLYNAR